jgi:CheY-like chemotaxis protein
MAVMVLFPMKILLVDDSKSARYALRLQLQRHGIDVETADCAESAFEYLKTQLPDAILMDHMMPGLNGFEALEVIREDPRTAHIPIVMCTSHEDADFVATANKKGVFGILPKSAAADLLGDILERLRAQLATTEIPAAPTIAPPVMTPIAPPITAPTPIAPAATPQLSESTILALIDEHLAALVMPLLDDLRRELSSELLRESRRMIDDAQLAAAAATPAPVASPSTAPAPTFADLQALSTRLSTETLPDLLKRTLDQERTQILISVEQRLRDQPVAAAPSMAAPIDENALLLKAHRDAKETVDAAVSTLQKTIQTLEQPTAPSGNGLLYGLFVMATLLGIGAAAAVYFVLAGAGIPTP